jgi:hypothetical protein
MRNRPQPTRYETPRQILAATFVYAHYLLTLRIGHDACRDFRVQQARRMYLAAVAAENAARGPDLFEAAA